MKLIECGMRLLSLIKRRKITLFWLIIILVPAVLSLREILLGTFSFWFDPARDLLLALNNLQKPTLIGVPTGIPGLFYGPYWLWFISLAMIVSKDPRIVTIIVLFIPYFVFFPLFLRRFDRIWGTAVSMAIWLIFIFNYRYYTNSLWNPHLAPLLFLILVSMIGIRSKPLPVLRYFLIGVVATLIVSLHFSFGIACLGATTIFLLLELIITHIKQRRNLLTKIRLFLCFIAGLITICIPTLVFEWRHGFMQIKTLVATVNNAVFFQTPAVGIRGLGKTDILNETLEQLTKLLQMPVLLVGILTLILVAKILFRRRRNFIDSGNYLNTFAYVLLVLFTVLGIFLTSKNPVWEYHFIAIEVILSILIGLLILKSKLVTYLALFWGIVIMLVQVNYVVSTLNFDLSSMSSYNTKLLITKKILEDAPDKFSVFTYSSAIYTYDFDYLFAWQTNKFHKTQIQESDVVYLIIPKTDPGILTDFIHYKTPDRDFSTQKTWEITDGTTIIKRQRK